MADAIGTILFVILSIVVTSIAATFLLWILGSVIGLLTLAVKLAVVAGILYVAWMVIRKFAEEK
jgi:hypothetical protein